MFGFLSLGNAQRELDQNIEHHGTLISPFSRGCTSPFCDRRKGNSSTNNKNQPLHTQHFLLPTLVVLLRHAQRKLKRPGTQKPFSLHQALANNSKVDEKQSVVA